MLCQPGKLTIWLVEDDPAQSELMRYLLKRHGTNVDLKVLPSGEGLLACLKAHLSEATQLERNLIMTDVHLAEGSGFDVLALLQADPLTKDIPVIFLSGEANPELVRKSKALGAFDYCVKPDSLEKLEDFIKATLARWSPT